MTAEEEEVAEFPAGGGGGWWSRSLPALTPVAVLGTLVCYALPIALVTLGLGSAMASALSAAPWLVEISRYKGWVFAGTGLLLAADWWVLYRSAAACEPGAACSPERPFGRWMRRIYWACVGLYGVGLVAAYVSVPLVTWLDGLGT